MSAVMDGQMNLFDQDTWCGRTCPAHWQATEETTLRQSSKKSSKSQNRKRPIFKCLNMDGPCGGATATWEDDGAWLIESTTLNGTECPNIVVESRLSQILEEAPPTKYYLSRAACLGILRRAERRGKDLPEQLKLVLLMQSASGGGCEGGGKGALVQREKSGTLGTGNDQTLFCMATQQGGAEIRSDGKAPTLTAAAGMPGNDQPTVYCLQGNGIDRADTAGCNGKGWREDVSYTLNTVDRPAVCAGFKLGSSEKSRSIGYEEEMCPTLTAESGGNKPAVLQAYSFDSLASNSMKSKNPNSGCRMVDCAKTLDTAPPDPSKNQGGIAILDMTHANDVIRECGEIVPSLQARMGTGGNQVPLTYQMQGFGDYREGKVASSCKQRDYKDSTDLVCAVDCRNFTENGNVNGTLQAKESGGSSLNLNNVCRQSGTVRRLTPLECTRLQGFPDRWVDIGEWTDEKGRVHKEADAPKYKALGNSIAIPFWKWLLRRISEYLPAGATLGSLFDGIGGFPLCWAEIHGAENCRWASEIEQFPIAVVKRHFGDEDAGIIGDVDKFLKGETVC